MILVSLFNSVSISDPSRSSLFSFKLELSSQTIPHVSLLIPSGAVSLFLSIDKSVLLLLPAACHVIQ